MNIKKVLWCIFFEIEIKDYKNNKTASSQSREKQNCKVVYHMKTHI